MLNNTSLPCDCNPCPSPHARLPPATLVRRSYLHCITPPDRYRSTRLLRQFATAPDQAVGQASTQTTWQDIPILNIYFILFTLRLMVTKIVWIRQCCLTKPTLSGWPRLCRMSGQLCQQFLINVKIGLHNPAQLFSSIPAGVLRHFSILTGTPQH